MQKRNPNKPDQEQGIYQKYYVERVDGSSAPGGKHANDKYFVLNLTTDKFAKIAAVAYAIACREEYPELSKDLLDFSTIKEIRALVMDYDLKGFVEKCR